MHRFAWIALICLAACAHTSSRNPSAASLAQQFPKMALYCQDKGQFVTSYFQVNDVFTTKPTVNFMRDRFSDNVDDDIEQASCAEKDNGLTCFLGRKNQVLRIEYADLVVDPAYSSAHQTRRQHRPYVAKAIFDQKPSSCDLYWNGEMIHEALGFTGE